jgi:hypothetical protein
MQHPHPVYSGIRLASPETRVGQHNSLTGHGFKTLFVNEAQTLFIQRVLAHTDYQRLKDSVLFRVSLLPGTEAPLE